jgi:hypothetical protein
MRAVGKKRTKREDDGNQRIQGEIGHGGRKKVSRWKTMRKVQEETRNILKAEEWDRWRNPPAMKTDENVPRAL